MYEIITKSHGKNLRRESYTFTETIEHQTITDVPWNTHKLNKYKHNKPDK